MTYNKDPNMKYTDMCIYFDANIYKADRNDYILYQYLYHIAYMLASKGRYFKNFDDYDTFALYAATKIYMRIPQKDECEQTPKEKRIKSILNYMKASIYPLKVDYQNENFAQLYSYTQEELPENFANESKRSIQNTYSEGLFEEVVRILELFPALIKKRLLATHYKNDALLIYHLYISCLLTFINSFTLTNKELYKVSKKKTTDDKEELFLKFIRRDRHEAVLLWHLDDSFANFVLIIVNRVRNEIDKELYSAQNSYRLSESELNKIMMSTFMETDYSEIYDEWERN